MKAKAAIGSRYLLGAIFTIFGLNGFLQFIPMGEMTSEAGQFFGALASTDYFLPFLKLVEITCGVLLLANRFVPLVLVVLAPIVVQIFLFHVFLDSGALLLGILNVGLLAYLGYAYSKVYAGLLTSKSKLSIK